MGQYIPSKKLDIDSTFQKIQSKNVFLHSFHSQFSITPLNGSNKVSFCFVFLTTQRNMEMQKKIMEPFG